MKYQKTAKKAITALIFTVFAIRIIYRFVSLLLVLGKTMKYLMLGS